jgi:hypothetical protein
LIEITLVKIKMHALTLKKVASANLYCMVIFDNSYSGKFFPLSFIYDVGVTIVYH